MPKSQVTPQQKPNNNEDNKEGECKYLMRARDETMSITEAKRRVCESVDRLAPILLDVSHRLHDHPELAFEEHYAHDLLTSVIAEQGLDVTCGAYGLDTAFEACAGLEAHAGAGSTTAPTVMMICEYDALPGIGHACGHNIIAAIGLGAGLAASEIAVEAQGRLVILGTPAEEGGGGKELMLRQGAFEGVDVAMMIHPNNLELPGMNALAVDTVVARYQGEASHASAAPEKGRNALDAAVLGYNAIAALRQHIDDNERIHGVFLDGGAKPNIVPASAATEWYVRSPNVESLELLKSRVVSCLKAGADATGCSVELNWSDVAYADIYGNTPLSDAYIKNLETIGRKVYAKDVSLLRASGSTDMGNVSQIVPSIHPMMKVSPDDVVIHTLDFAKYARGDAGDAAVIDGAKVLAMTAVDCWLDGVTLDAARAFFQSARY